MSEDDMPHWKLYLIFFFAIISGAFSTIFLKLQNMSRPLGVRFKHPWFQAILVFISEIIYLFVHEKETIKPDLEKFNQKTRINSYLIMIPTICDILGTVTQDLCLVFVSASVYQMVSSGVVIVTATLSILIVKKKYYRHHFLGMLLVSLGIFIASFFSIRKTNDVDEANEMFFGVILGLISLIFAGLRAVSEEYLFEHYDVHSFEMVGYEGLWGTIIMTILIGFFSFFSCDYFSLDFKYHVCTLNGFENVWKFEDIWFVFQQIMENKLLILYVIGFLITVSIDGWLSAVIVKQASSTAKVIVKNCRILVIYLFFQLFSVSIHTVFVWEELVGIFILYIGSLIFIEIIVFPCLGFADSTKIALKKIKEMEELKILNENDLKVNLLSGLETDSSPFPVLKK